MSHVTYRRRVHRIAETDKVAVFKSKSFTRENIQYFPIVRADGYCRCDCESHHYRHRDQWVGSDSKQLCIHLKRAIATLKREVA